MVPGGSVRGERNEKNMLWAYIPSSGWFTARRNGLMSMMNDNVNDSLMSNFLLTLWIKRFSRMTD